MDEDTAIINSNTRSQKIKNFFINNKKILSTIFSLLIILLIFYFAFEEIKDKKKISISDQYNAIIIEAKDNNKEITTKALVKLINSKDSTYSPLSLYYIVDNQLIAEKSKINNLFDIVIDDTPLQNEIKNLIIFKKALYNADSSDENELLKILKPIINSKSVWKSHALYLLAEFFYSKNEKQKAKEFFNQILTIENANQDLVKETKKRLNRDLSE